MAIENQPFLPGMNDWDTGTIYVRRERCIWCGGTPWHTLDCPRSAEDGVYSNWIEEKGTDDGTDTDGDTAA